MPNELLCPQCTMPDPVAGPDGFECQICGFEWQGEAENDIGEVRDANGTLLADGDTVTIVKDIPLNGKAGGVKVGTKVKSIRLIEGDHPIDGKVDGRSILIKAEFVKRAK